MKNLKIIYSIILSINIIVFFPKMSIYGTDKNDFFYNHKDEWEEYWKSNRESPTQMILCPGEDESKLNFSWYTKEEDGNSQLKIYYGNKEELINVDSINLNTGFISNKAILTDIRPNTTYYYSYKIGDKWTEKIPVKIRNKDQFSFIFMGDPQIGASYKSKNLMSYEDGIKIDSYNWNKVINQSLNKCHNASFILCAGDETNTKYDYSKEDKVEMGKMEYCGFLCPKYLRYTPIINAIGNHDESNIEFYHHFNQPNSSNLGITKAGGDSFFTYNDALFLILNTNNLNINEHENFIKTAVQKNKDKKWRIAVFHHDIFGGGIHSEDNDLKILRRYLPSILEENNISLVLNGHDHIHSRSYRLRGNEIINDSIIKESIEEINSKRKGVIYLTGSSCTGSKFYRKKINDKDYIKVKFQEEVPIYTVIDINKDEIIINSYRVDTDEKIDNTIRIGKLTY